MVSTEALEEQAGDTSTTLNVMMEHLTCHTVSSTAGSATGLEPKEG